MPFLQIGSLVVPVATSNAVKRGPERIGHSGRMFDGSLRTTVRKEKRSWTLSTKLLTEASAQQIEALVRNGAFLRCGGDLLYARTVDTDLFKYEAGDDLTALGAVSTRASIATYVDINGVIRTAAVDVPRDAHYINGVRTLLMESSKTNLCLRSQELSNAAWTDVGSPTVTADAAVAPDGTLTADRIDDSGAAETRGRRQTLTVANDSTQYTCSVYVRKRSSPHSTGWIVLNLRFLNGSTLDGYAGFDAYLGSVVKDGSLTYARIESVGNYWRISVTMSNNSSGNTSLLFSVYPAGHSSFLAATAIAGQGTEDFWGAQIETGPVPTSYIATTTVSVTRSSDTFYFPYAARPQELTAYMDCYDLGSILITSGRFLQVGAGSNAAPRLVLSQNGGGTIAFTHDPDGSSVLSNRVTNHLYLDRVEMRGVLGATGTATLATAVNAAAEVVGSTSAADTLQSVWSGERLYLRGVGADGFVAVRRVVVSVGTKSMADMRLDGAILCEVTVGDSPFMPQNTSFRRSLSLTLKEV